jgi:hypothetical protein
MLRMILAAVAGYVSIGLLVVSTDGIFAALRLASDHYMPTWYFAVSLVMDSLYSVVGGYVCAWLAREKARGAAIGLIVGGEIIGLASQIMLWNKAPHWYGIGLLVTYPIAVWFGGQMRRPLARSAAA